MFVLNRAAGFDSKLPHAVQMVRWNQVMARHGLSEAIGKQEEVGSESKQYVGKGRSPLEWRPGRGWGNRKPRMMR